MLTDKEIAELLSERKALRKGALNFLRQVGQCTVGQSRKRQVKCSGETGRRYSIFATYTAPKKPNYPPKYSVHVRYYPAGIKKFVTLVRCNSTHAAHSNRIEKKARSGIQIVPAGKYHIHTLTERYQQYEGKDLGYAEETSHYNCFDSAIEYTCYSYGFYVLRDQYKTRFPLFEQ